MSPFFKFAALTVLLVVGGGVFDAISAQDAVTEAACSASTRPYVFTAYTASFISPGRPGNYPNGANCHWLIVSQEPDGFVNLDFSLLSTEATHDYVFIHDGNSTSAPLLTGFEGAWNTPPKKVLSTQPFMYVVFTSDASIQDQGFVATYTSTPRFEVKDACSSLSRPLLVTSGSGEITSPNFSNNYWNNANCQWLIESQVPGGIVTLDFLNFFTEIFVDTVYLYDGTTTSAPLIAQLNGPQTTTGWKSTQLYMLVRFSSNGQNTRSGWRAEFSSQAAP